MIILTYVSENDIEAMIEDEDYKFLGLFNKLCFQFEKNGQFEIQTKNKFDELSTTMPKSFVKVLNEELANLK